MSGYWTDLLPDLAPIAGDVSELVGARNSPRHQWNRPTLSGRWAGEACRYEGKPVLACDTFFDADNGGAA
jgi:hypothetical protein